MPEVDSPRTWFLIRASSTPAEIEQVRAQIRAANWVVIPRDFDTHLPRWPEFTDELQQGHFQLVKEYHLFLLLRRMPAL
jgi:hypothetical protein